MTKVALCHTEAPRASVLHWRRVQNKKPVHWPPPTSVLHSLEEGAKQKAGALAPTHQCVALTGGGCETKSRCTGPHPPVCCTHWRVQNKKQAGEPGARAPTHPLPLVHADGVPTRLGNHWQGSAALPVPVPVPLPLQCQCRSLPLALPLCSLSFPPSSHPPHRQLRGGDAVRACHLTVGSHRGAHAGAGAVARLRLCVPAVTVASHNVRKWRLPLCV